MARQFLAALTLAYSATALIEPFIDVLVHVDVHVTPDIFAGVLNAVGKSDNGSNACVAAGEVLSSCSNAGAFATTAQTSDADRCACCLGTTAISPVYSICASYFANQGPGASTAFSVVSEVYSICSVQRPCTGAAAATATSTTSLNQSSTLPAVTTIPTACESMAGILSSCSEKLGIRTSNVPPPRDIASCFCYDQSGAWNTAFEDYASSCAPFFKTNYPTDYSIVTALETFCDAYAPSTNTNPLVLTTVGTRSESGFVLSSSSSTLLVTSHTGPATSTATTSHLVVNVAPRQPIPGFVLWAANLVTFLLSFFVLV